MLHLQRSLLWGFSHCRFTVGFCNGNTLRCYPDATALRLLCLCRRFEINWPELQTYTVRNPHGVRDLVKSKTATPWLTSREAASYLKIEHRTVLLWARLGKIKGYVLSGHRRHVWRFRAVDLDAMLLQPVVLSSRET